MGGGAQVIIYGAYDTFAPGIGNCPSVEVTLIFAGNLMTEQFGVTDLDEVEVPHWLPTVRLMVTGPTGTGS